MFDRILTTGTGDSNNYKITNYEVGKVKSVEWPWHGKVTKEVTENGGVITVSPVTKLELPSGKIIVVDPIVGSNSYYSLIRFKDPTSVSTLSPDNPDWQIWDDCLYRPDSIFLYGKDQGRGSQNFLFHDGTYNLVVSFLDEMGYNDLSYKVKIGFITPYGFQPLHNDISMTIPTFSGGKEQRPPVVLDATLDGSKILLELYIEWPADSTYEENWTGNWFGILQISGIWPNYTFSFTKDSDEYFDKESSGADPYEVAVDANGDVIYTEDNKAICTYAPYPNGDFFGGDTLLQSRFASKIITNIVGETIVGADGVPNNPPPNLDAYTTEPYYAVRMIYNTSALIENSKKQPFNYTYNYNSKIKQRISGFFSGTVINYIIKEYTTNYSLSNKWEEIFSLSYTSMVSGTSSGTITWHQGGPGGEGPCGIIVTGDKEDYGCWWILENNTTTVINDIPDPFTYNSNRESNYTFLTSTKYYCNNSELFEDSRGLDLTYTSSLSGSSSGSDGVLINPVVDTNLAATISGKIGDYEYNYTENSSDRDFLVYHMDGYGRVNMDGMLYYKYGVLDPTSMYIIRDDTIPQTSSQSYINLNGNSIIAGYYNVVTITGVSNYPFTIANPDLPNYITTKAYLSNYSYNGNIIHRNEEVSDVNVIQYACYNPKTEEFLFSKDIIWWI